MKSEKGSSARRRLFVFFKWAVRLGLLLVLAVIVTLVSSRLGAREDAIKVYRHGDGSSHPPQVGGLTVGAYNIAHGRGGKIGAPNRRSDGKDGLIAHLKEIGREIREQQLDIVVLNEVDFSSSWSWRVNQAQLISEAAGLPYIVEQRNYDCSLLFYKWEFGNAVLSRYPIRAADLIEYPAVKEHEKIVFGKKDGCICQIATPEANLNVVAVHLDVHDQATRDASMKILEQLEASLYWQHFLIMGDFNSQAVFEGSERLGAAVGQGETFPSNSPNRKIDWIVSGPSLELSSERVFGGALSDHLGVKAPLIRIVELEPR